MQLSGSIASEILGGLVDHDCYARLIGGSELELLSTPKKRSEIQCPECKRFEMVCCHTPEGKVAICSNVDCSTMDRMRVLKERERQQAVGDIIGKKLVDLVQVGIPASHQHCKMSNFNSNTLDVAPKFGQKTLDQLTAFLNNDEWCLMLTGGVGKGKTHLAVALLRKLSSMGRDVQMTQVYRILSDLREAQTRNQHEDVVIAKYVSRDVLCLDDLGATAPTSHQIDKLYELLDRRSQERKKTIVTTNMTYADIEEVFGKRLSRRLTDKVFAVSFKTQSNQKLNRMPYNEE